MDLWKTIAIGVAAVVAILVATQPLYVVGLTLFDYGQTPDASYSTMRSHCFGSPSTNGAGRTRYLWKEVRSSVGSYLETVGSAYIEPADRSPPAPEITAFRDAGIPTVSDEEFLASIANMNERRRTLLGLVGSDQREWPTAERT